MDQVIYFDKKLLAIKPKIIKSCAQPICTGLAYCVDFNSKNDIPYTTLLTCKNDLSNPLECPAANHCNHDKTLKVDALFPLKHVDKKEDTTTTTTPNEAKVN